MHWIMQFIDLFLNVDTYLADLVTRFGAWVYGILFVVIFCETGLVVTPFLPGDSLIFAAGTIAGAGHLNPIVLALVLFAAAVLGDAANYLIGRFFGDWLLKKRRRLIHPEHIASTQAFFVRHGGKAVFLARFVPFARTFAPFVAGVGRMHPGHFFGYNIAGAAAWVGVFVAAGVFFGNVSFVKHNLTLVLIGVVIVSVLPGVIAWAKHKLAARRAAAEAPSTQGDGDSSL